MKTLLTIINYALAIWFSFSTFLHFYKGEIWMGIFAFLVCIWCWVTAVSETVNDASNKEE